MFGRKNTANTADAVAEYKTAKKALHENQRAEKAAGIREETDTFHALNGRVLEAEKNVPWYRR
ncbi:hypothetical protein [Streptomyces noursei]|uniref:hypothetical protein n=1 Tax=Streptomyces noursei TaxID=1971 RepID=UPI003807C85B